MSKCEAAYELGEGGTEGGACHLNRGTAPVIRGGAGRGRGVVVITKRFKLGQFETSIAAEKII